MPAAVAEILAHSATRIRCNVLQRCRITGRGGDDNRVLHGAVFFEGTHHLRHRRTLLANCHVNTHYSRVPLMPVRLLIPSVTLIDNSVDSNCRFASLAVANDQFALATTNWHHGVNGLQPRL